MAVDHQCSVQNQMTPTMFTTIQTNQFSRTFLVVSQVASKENTKNCASSASRQAYNKYMENVNFTPNSNHKTTEKNKVPTKKLNKTQIQIDLPIDRTGKASF